MQQEKLTIYIFLVRIPFALEEVTELSRLLKLTLNFSEKSDVVTV